VHLHQQRYGSRAIARRVRLNRKTVRRILCEEGYDPANPAQAKEGSKLEPFRQAIEERVVQRLTITRILREVRSLGYTGGRTILADYVHSLEGPLAPRKPTKRRFETPPGEEMQVDWTVYTVPVADEPLRVHALGCILAHSRYVSLRFYRNERESTLLEGLARSFEAFHGVTQRVVFDNMATVVLGRIGSNHKPLWHPRLLEFARHYGFRPFACRVRDPDRKGKIERIFDFLEKDFIRGSTFSSFEDLNERTAKWVAEVANRRVHGTTGLVPEEAWFAERDFLIRLPEARFAVYEETVRDVDDDATVSIGGIRYRLPATVDRGSHALRLYAEHFEVLDRHGNVVFSRRYAALADRSRLQLDPAHDAPPPGPLHSASGHRLDEQFLSRFPDLAPLVEGIARRMKSLAHIHLRALWRLAETYGEPAFLGAAKRAQQYHRYDAQAVRRLLEREHPLASSAPSPLALHDASRVHNLLGDVDSGSLDAYGHLDTDPPADACPDNTVDPSADQATATPRQEDDDEA
jgi:transposase